MKSELAKAEKYPIIESKVMASSQSAGSIYVRTLVFFSLFWFLFSGLVQFLLVPQVICVLVLVTYHAIRYGAANEFMRSGLELKAKGLDIEDRTLNAIMPWDWLTKVEIRQRSFSIFPNYVYFQFKDKSDVLILWEDVRDYMDSTIAHFLCSHLGSTSRNKGRCQIDQIGINRYLYGTLAQRHEFYKNRETPKTRPNTY